MMFAEILGWIVANYVIISFLEHLFHKWCMHRKEIPSRLFPKPVYMWVYEAHAIYHHGKYYKVFNHEPDEYGRFCNIHLVTIHTVLASAPLWGTIMHFSPVGGILMVLMTILHHQLWNISHEEMHIPKHPQMLKFAPYAFLARYHFLHHQYPTKNFNVVFPLADYVLGAHASGNEEDKTEMRRLGLA
jgi:hypothetical protein